MKKMKRVGTLLLCTAMAMSVFGCAKTTKKTGANGEEWNEEVESAVNEVLKETSEDEIEEATEAAADKEPDTVITYGDEGKYRYTMTIYGCDGVVTRYEGKTDLGEWKDLMDEMSEAGIFSYVPINIIMENGDWYTGSCGISSVNGQDAGAGYYACYVDGVFKDDFSSVMNIIGAGDNDLVIKYCENNWLPSEDIFMPDSSAVHKLYICTEEDTWSLIHEGNDDGKESILDYSFRHDFVADTTHAAGKFTDEYWDELIGIIENLPDLEVYAKTSFYSEPLDGQVVIYLNYNVCLLTSDPDGTLVNFLSGYETSPEITLK